MKKRKEQVIDVLHLDERVRMYDGAVKSIFKNKQILALLLQGCIREFQRMPCQSILDGCLVDALSFFRAYHRHRWSQGVVEAFTAETEIADSQGRRGQMDLCFYVRDPGSAKPNAMQIVDVEFQNDRNPGYPLMKRANYYVASMMYMQYGRNFTKSDYNMLLKSTSIWLCPCKMSNFAVRYCMAEEPLVGDVPVKDDDYDMMRIVKIYFNPDGELHENAMIGMLQTLFSRSLTVEEKVSRLKEKYSITLETSEELKDMIDLSEYYKQAWYEDGIAEGMKRGVKKGIKQGMQRGMQRGIARGMKRGREEGAENSRRNTANRLVSSLKDTTDVGTRIANALMLVTTETVSLKDIWGILTEAEYAAVVKQLEERRHNMGMEKGSPASARGN